MGKYTAEEVAAAQQIIAERTGQSIEQVRSNYGGPPANGSSGGSSGGTIAQQKAKSKADEYRAKAAAAGGQGAMYWLQKARDEELRNSQTTWENLSDKIHLYMGDYSNAAKGYQGAWDRYMTQDEADSYAKAAKQTAKDSQTMGYDLLGFLNRNKDNFVKYNGQDTFDQLWNGIVGTIEGSSSMLHGSKDLASYYGQFKDAADFDAFKAQTAAPYSDDKGRGHPSYARQEYAKSAENRAEWAAGADDRWFEQRYDQGDTDQNIYKSLDSGISKMEEERQKLLQQRNQGVWGGKGDIRAFGQGPTYDETEQDRASRDIDYQIRYLDQAIANAKRRRDQALQNMSNSLNAAGMIGEGYDIVQAADDEFAARFAAPTKGEDFDYEKWSVENPDYVYWAKDHPGATMEDYAKSLREDRRVGEGWTHEQQKQFYILQSQVGQEAADRFAVSVNEKIRREKREQDTKGWAEFGRGDNMSKEAREAYSGIDNFDAGLRNALTGAAAIGAGVVAAPEHLLNWIEDISNASDSRREGYYAGAKKTRLTDYTDAAVAARAQGLNEDYGTKNLGFLGEKGLGDIYQLAQSMAQSVTYGNLAGEAATLMMFFGQAADQSYQEAKKRGGSNEYAAVVSLLSGVAEVMGEKTGLDHLLNPEKSMASSMLRYLLEQGGIEGAEEGITDILNIFGDELAARVTGGRTEMEETIRGLMESGMNYDEAVRQAWTDQAKETAWSVAGGFLSGFGSGVMQDVAQGGIGRSIASKKAEKGSAAAIAESIRKNNPDFSEADQLGRAIYREAHGQTLSSVQQRVIDENREIADPYLKGIGKQIKQERGVAREYARSNVKAGNQYEEFETDGGRAKIQGMRYLDGKVQVEVRKADGSTALMDVDDVRSNVSQETGELLYQLAGLGQDAVAAFKVYDKNQGVADYVSAMDTGINMLAANGANRAALDKTALTKGLTATQKDVAYEIGHQRFEKARAAAPGSSAAFNKRADVSFNGNTLGMQGLRTQTEAKVQKAARQVWGKEYSDNVRFASAVAKATGLNIVFFDSTQEDGTLGKSQGMYAQDGTVYVDIHAGQDSAGVGQAVIARTLSHELTHFLEKNAPKSYQELRAFVVNHLAELGGGVFEERVNAKMRRSKGNSMRKEEESSLSYEEAVNEVVADACEMMLTNSDMIQKLAEEHHNTATKIWQHIKDIFAKMREAVKPKSAEAVLLEKQFKEMSKLWDDALAQAVENTKSVEARVKQAVASSALQFSGRIDLSKVGIPWDSDDNSSIKNQVLRVIENLNKKKPVASIAYNKASGKNYVDQLDEILRTRFGYKIDRDGFGVFLFDKKAIAILRHYVGSDAEAAAAIASPYVLKRGDIISGHKHHNGGRYPSVTFAAPVTLNGKNGIEAVSVLFADKNRVHALRILDVNGKEFTLPLVKEKTDSEMEGVAGEPTITVPTEPVSNNIVSDVTEKSKGEMQHSFRGERADNADLEALNRAKEMEKRNVSNETIRQETGWFRGMDGKWRSEIDDSWMRYFRNGDAQFRADHPEYAEYQEMMGKILTGDYGQVDMSRLKELDATFGRELPRLSERVKQGNATLQNLIQHDALFEAYPFLRNTRVRFVEGQEAKGSYDAKSNTISLKAELQNNPDSTLLHEIQHAIQSYEGFATGSSKEAWAQRLKNGYAEKRKSAEFEQADRAYRELFDSAPEELKNKIRELNRAKLESDLDRWDSIEAELYDGPYSDLFVKIDQADFERRRVFYADKKFDAYDLYRNTAGEIEARDVQARQELDSEQRKNTPPNLGDENTVFAQFSIRDDTTQDTAEETAERVRSYNQIKADNAALRRTVDRLKREMRPTKERTVRRSDAVKLAREILRDLQTDVKTNELADVLERMGNYLVSTETEELDYEVLRRMAAEAAQKIVDTAEEPIESGMTEIRDGLKKYLKGNTLQLPEEYIKDLGQENLTAWRKLNRGVKVSTKEGLAVDIAYQELQEMFGEGVFPDSVTHPADQLNLIADTIDRAGREETRNPFAGYEGEAVDVITDQIFGAALGEELRQTAPTMADKHREEIIRTKDKYARKLEETREKDRERLERLRDEKNARIAAIKESSRVRLDESIARERAKKWEKVEALREFYREKEKRAVTRRKERTASTELRHKIRKLHSEMTRRLLRPTENKYVPENLVKSVANLLEAVNLDSGRSSKMTDAFNELNLQYHKLAENTKTADMVDPVVQDMLDKLGDRLTELKGASIFAMNSRDLKMIYDTMRAVDHTTRATVRLINYQTEKDAYEIAEGMIGETRAAKRVLPAAKKWLFASMRAESFFKRMAGYAINSNWSMLYDMLDKAQLKQTRLLMEGSAYFEELMQDTKALDAMTNTRDLIDIGLRDPDGNAVKVTKGFAVKIFLDTLNEQNARHLMYGAYTVPDMKQYYKSSSADAYNNGTRVQGYGVRLSELRQAYQSAETEEQRQEIEEQIREAEEEAQQWVADLRQNILNTFGEYEHKWVKAWQDFATFSQRTLNETSKAVYGFEKANVENYVPIHTDKNFRAAQFDSITRDISLENVGFMKERVPSASNPMLAEDIVDVASRQIENMAKYSAMMPAVKNFQKVYSKGKAGFADSVQNAVAQTFGEDASNYIQNLMTDLTSPRHTEGGMLGRFADVLRGNLARASLTINPRVALGQAASYPTAAAVIGWKPLAKAFRDGANPIRNEQAREEIAKWSPLMWYRMQGFFDREVGDLRKDRGIVAKAFNKVSFLTNWIEYMDGATVGRLWYAAQAYVEEKNPDLQNGSDEFMQKSAEIFNKIVQETQPNYTTLQRPDILRNPNAIVRQLTTFMTQRLQNTNILFDAVGEYNAAVRGYKNKTVSMEQMKEAKQKLVNGVSSQLAAAATIVIFKALADALMYNMKRYRDDDDELTADSFLDALLNNFFESLASNFLGGSELYSFARSIFTDETYYGISLSGVELFTDTINSINKTLRDPSGDNIKRATLDALRMFGLPFQNAAKFVNAFRLRLQDAKEGNSMFGFDSEIQKTNSSQARALYKAMIAEDEEKIDELTEYFGSIRQARSAVANHIKKQLKDGKMTEEEATEALKEYAGYTTDEAFWAIRKATGGEKYNMWADIDAAVRAGDQEAFDEAEDFMNEHGYENSTVRSHVESSVHKWFTTGEEGRSKISQEEAIKLLTSYAGLSQWEAKDKVREWKIENTYGITYDEIQDLFVDGAVEYSRAVDMLFKFGPDGETTGAVAELARKEARDKVDQWRCEKETGIRYSQIQDAYIHGDITDKQAVDWQVKYGHKSQEDAEKRTLEWAVAKDYGIKYSSSDYGIKAAFLQGEISAETAKAIMITYGGKAESDAEAYTSQYEFTKETGFNWSDGKGIQEAMATGKYSDDQLAQWEARANISAHGSLQVGMEYVEIAHWFNEVEGCTSFNRTNLEKWEKNSKYIIQAGMGREEYAAAAAIYNNTHSDYDSTTGESIANSKCRKVLEQINEMDLTKSQKETLARSLYTKKSINKAGRPW